MNKLCFPLKRLWFFHIFIIVLSNYAVQIPLVIGSINTTWGTFTYPFIFLTTDLTVRIYGQSRARVVVFMALVPALLLSYLTGTLFEQGAFRGFDSLLNFSPFVFRIALASLGAYVAGQLADILVFQRLRRLKQWWPAPAASSVFGNLLDTWVFFAIAFCGCSVPFMAEHWPELAMVDYLIKITANIAIFLPVYGVVLNFLTRYLLKPPLNYA